MSLGVDLCGTILPYTHTFSPFFSHFLPHFCSLLENIYFYAIFLKSFSSSNKTPSITTDPLIIKGHVQCTKQSKMSEVFSVSYSDCPQFFQFFNLSCICVKCPNSIQDCVWSHKFYSHFNCHLPHSH